jgi:ADP-ribosylglycohydrolase
VVETQEAAAWCLLNTGGFEEAVLRAVNLGGETDTTGAVTGGLAGARYGPAAVPQKWLSTLARPEKIDEMIDEPVLSQFKRE